MNFPEAYLDNQRLAQALKAEEMNVEFEELKKDAASRIANYRYYLNYFQGKFSGDFAGRAEGRARHITNLCGRAVNMIAQFTLPELFDIHVPRLSELTGKHDVQGDKLPDYTEEFDRSEIIEKKLRMTFADFDNQGEREFKQGMSGGLTFGDTIFFVPFMRDKKTFQLQSLFPGHVRIRFASNNYTEVEHAFTAQVVSIAVLRKKYQMDFEPENPKEYWNDLWDSHLLDGKNYTVLKRKITADKLTTFVGNKILEEIDLVGEGVPLFHIPAIYNPFSSWGTSYLKDIIPINKELNEATSDEADIVKIFSNPKVIIRNATQKDIDNIKKMWKKGVVASKGNLEVQPFEFRNNIFPIEQRIQQIMERFYKISGLGPAVFGQPPGSINTGPSLTVQYAPTLQMSQIVWNNWQPKLLTMFAYMLKTLEKHGGKEEATKKDWKEIVGGNYQVKITAPFRVPREESIHVANEVNKYVQGLQSKTRTMQNLGIESPEDELILSAYEKLNPILNPELFLELRQQQLEQEQALTPAAGAQIGGDIASAQANNQTLARITGGSQPSSRISAQSKGSVGAA